MYYVQSRDSFSGDPRQEFSSTLYFSYRYIYIFVCKEIHVKWNGFFRAKRFSHRLEFASASRLPAALKLSPHQSKMLPNLCDGILSFAKLRSSIEKVSSKIFKYFNIKLLPMSLRMPRMELLSQVTSAFFSFTFFSPLNPQCNVFSILLCEFYRVAYLFSEFSTINQTWKYFS